MLQMRDRPTRLRWPRRRAIIVGVAVSMAIGGAGTMIAQAKPVATAKKPYRVAMLLPGTTSDRSWSNANADGGKLAMKLYGAQVTIVGSLLTPDQYLAQGAAFARRGYDMVMSPFGAVTTTTEQLAKQFPKTLFGVLYEPTPAQLKALPPNEFTWDPAQEDGAFLAGVLAGLYTKTNVVGSVDSTPFPAVTRQMEAFGLGARCVNPKVKALQRHTGEAAGSNVGLGKAAGLSLMGQGADVLLAVLDGSTNGLYQAARTRSHTYVIAQYFDQAAKAPDVILTSVLYNLQGINADLIHKGIQGKVKPHSFFVYNLKNMNVGTLAPFSGHASVSETIKRKLAAIEVKIKSGQIRVPNVTKIGTPGSGAKINPKSIGC
jgi:basic membrane protein A